MPSERLRLRDIRNTSTFRLTFALGAVAIVGVASLLVLVYALSARQLNARSDLILREEAARMIAMPRDALEAEVRQAMGGNASGLDYYGLLAADGTKLAGNLRGSAGFTPGKPREISASPGRHGPIRLLGTRLASGEMLLIGRDITPLVDLRWRVTMVLIASGIVITLLIAATAVAVSLAPLRRVGRLQRIAQEIAAGDLERRMPVLGRGDELDLLAGTVNGMVEEVGRVIGQVKSVTDAIAHDLRTPLTRMRSHLDRARRQPGLDAATAERLGLVVDDLDTVLERFAALLRISELEAGSRRAGFGEVPLDPLLSSAVDLYQPLAEDRGVALALTGLPDAHVVGDRSLLFEALSNLLDNAIKFTPRGGAVRLSAFRDADGLCIEVRDDGPGISEDHRQSVLRRFDRGDVSAEVPGSGLGLSVVVAIVHLHQFTLTLGEADPGLIVRIGVPDRNSFPIQP
jgi:signal transduction histidine kinase